MNYIVDLTSPFIWVFFLGSALQIIWNSWLSWRERDFVLKTEGEACTRLHELHSLAKDAFTEEKLKRSLSYERTSNAFSLFHGKCNRIIQGGILLFGLIPWLFSILLSSVGLPFVVSAICISVALNWLDNIIDIPFDWHSTFTLEERFGFNTTTKKIFWTDFFKNQLVSAIFTAGSIALSYFCLYGIHKFYGRVDWKVAIAFAVFNVIFGMLIEIVYMKIITPSFNKVEPMKDCELKTKMETLLKKFGFSPKGVFVIDESKRSRHMNAYCTGWGKNKRLVLFDTLLKHFTDDEILAILGHELAHAKLGHLVLDRILEVVQMSVFLIAASFFIYSTPMLAAFGYRGDAVPVQDGSVAAMTAVAFIALMLFRKVFSSVDWITDGIGSWISRKMEFAADKYSCKYTGKAESAIAALFKLYGENLSYPISDKIFEMWHFSHPSLVNRVEALKRVADEARDKSK